jgi:branched-chain amino acid transport system substrate-binding protein
LVATEGHGEMENTVNEGDCWRVGVLFSQTGVTAAIERSQLNATLLAIDEINQAGGVLGRPIQPVPYDPASNPKQFKTLAERLLTVDRVRLIFGCYMSSTRKAVLPVVEAYRGLLFYPTLYEGFEYSPHCIYTGAAPNQNSLQLAKFLLQNYGNRFVLVGSNYIYPYESNRIMADFITQSKGKVLDEIYVPLEAKAKDFEKAIARIGRLRPDVVFSTVVGQSTAIFYEAYRQAGFDSNKMPIASLTTSEAEVAEMSAEAAEGNITAAPFFEVLATPAARKFISAFKLRHGSDAPVTAGAEAAYFQVHIAAGALARAGTDDPERLLPELRDAEFDAPQGRVRIDPTNNHTYLWPRVARVDARRCFQIVWNPGVRVKPDPYCIVLSLDDWSADGLQQMRA